MRVANIVWHCFAWGILCLPFLRAKDLFPFLDDSLLKLEEEDGSNDYEEDVPQENLPYDDFEDQSDEKGGWTEWGPWMMCSRSCDGGIAISLRKCRGRCPTGEPIRRQICNMQPCPEPTDFRAAQCSAYNNRPYRGRFYKWLPFNDPEDPCVLACQAEGFGFVAKHSKKVHDGTRCREGALDMCVDGQCQPIGCDLRVGSTLKVDECGVCGGDGSQCHRPTFVWHEGTFGACSVTCGGGIQLSEATCRNKETNEEVDLRLCNLSIRPRTKAMHCNREPCPVVWETGEWGPCSATCGPGIQSRPAFCVQGGPNGSRIDVKTQFCPAHKPQTERSCVVEECPRWFQGPWTPCSATCGFGIQTRAVVCRDTKSQYSDNCDLSEMPRPQRPCNSRVLHCPTPPSEDKTTPQPCVYTPGTENESEQTTTEEPTTEMEPVIMLTEAPVNLTGVIGPMYFVGPWGRCSGQGYRHRAVYCRVFIEVAKTAARLPDSQCTDARPTDVEPCAVSCPPPFPSREVVASVKEVGQIESEDLEPEKSETFHSWNTEKFSPCSSSCGGGVHTSLVRCLRLPEQVEVSPQLCDQEIKPEPLTKRCNIQPCPVSYRWNVSEFSNCSRECGGGIRTRVVKCIQVENDEESPFIQCPGMPPKAAENCNVFDCPEQWKAEPWSKCSKTCDGGFQTRKLHCEKILAPLSQTVQLPPSKCVKTRPKAVKKCNLKPCPPPPTRKTTTSTSTTTTSTTTTTTERPQTEEEEGINGSHVFDQKYPNRRVNLKAQGRAILFKGSNAKFHCPLHLNNTRVLWFKGHLRIPPSTTNGWPRVAVSGKGALRIHKVAFGDEGTYTCLSGGYRSDVELKVKPLPPKQPEFFVESSTIAATTPTPATPSRKVTYRSALPQVRHFLVNLRHFEEERLQSDPVVLEYDWVVGPWSQCSQTCGDDGMQVRTADCRVRVLSNATRIVSRGLCIDGGLPEPATIRPCNLEPCPEWITSEWSECSFKNCFSWNTAYQKRSVLCGISNRTVTPSHCDSRKRPRRKKECHNPECRGSWKVSNWTKCTATCGNKGFQTRGVQCVWQGTREPAPSSACKGPMPKTSIPCGRVPCLEDEYEEDCFDQSTYCSVVKETKLCEISQFRLQCCASCSRKK